MKSPHNTHLLIELAKHAQQGIFEGSTSQFSKQLGMSQQSVSRLFIDLEKKKFIRRMVNQKGTTIIIDTKGKELLAERYAALKNFFEHSRMKLQGKVKTGLGEGKYYMSQPEYQKQFKEKFGFKAYPGTLNIDVDATHALMFINSLNPLRINGFERKERTFGALTGYKIIVNDVEGALVIPDRTAHDRSTLEIIAPVYLRDRLNLKDGDKITLRGE